ncbi:MAG TPA: ABC transporter permease [Longimicrobiales bacterium]
MDALLQDLRYALRSLRRAPGFTAAAVLTLAFGIGANTAIFSIASGLVLEAIPFAEPERLVNVDHVSRSGRVGGAVAWSDFDAWRRELGGFESLAARTWHGYTLSHDGSDRAGALKASGYRVTPGFFATLGARLLLGRGFLAEEGEAGSDAVVVLSQQVWERYFGADPDILGRTVRVDGAPRTVVGVLRGEHRFPAGADLWVPLVPTADELDVRLLGVIGRLEPGVTLAQAHAELDALQDALERERPEDRRVAGTRVVPLAEQQTEYQASMLGILLVAVGFVLLIACANVAGMLLARATARRQEIAVRASLGAGRGRIARQLLTESLLLALLAGALGTLLGRWGVTLLSGATPEWMARGVMGWERIDVDVRTLGYTLALTLGTGILFGLAPALHAARADFAGVLRDGARGATGRHAAHAQRTLLAAEVALAVVLLAGAGLLVRSLIGLQAARTGFDGDGVLTLELALPPAQYDAAEILAYQDRLLDRVRALPGVVEAGIVSNLPMSMTVRQERFRVLETGAAPPLTPTPGPTPTDRTPEPPAWAATAPGTAPASGSGSGARTRTGAGDDAPVEGWAAWRPATPGFLGTLRIPLLRGRDFTAADRAGAPRVVIVSEAMARRYFPAGDALGRRLVIQGEERRIVGIAGDVAQYGPERGLPPTVYAPYAQAPTTDAFLAVRTAGEPASLAAPVRAVVAALDPDVAIARVSPMNDVVAAFRAPDRLMTAVLSVFAAMAMLIAAIGLYGVVAYAVERRRREFGIRLALGARAADIVRLVARWGLVPVAAGTALGLLGALGLGRALAGSLYGVRPGDPVVLGVTALLLLATAAAAAFVPTRRAIGVDPAATLREE